MFACGTTYERERVRVVTSERLLGVPNAHVLMYFPSASSTTVQRLFSIFPVLVSRPNQVDDEIQLRVLKLSLRPESSGVLHVPGVDRLI